MQEGGRITGAGEEHFLGSLEVQCVMITCGYDSDANFLFLLLPYYHPSSLTSAVLLSYLPDPCSPFVSSFVHLSQPHLHSLAYDS